MHVSNSQVFFSEKMLVVFANAKATHIFSATILAYIDAIFNDQSFNDTLTNIVSFEQLGPDQVLWIAKVPIFLYVDSKGLSFA